MATRLCLRKTLRPSWKGAEGVERKIAVVEARLPFLLPSVVALQHRSTVPRVILVSNGRRAGVAVKRPDETKTSGV